MRLRSSTSKRPIVPRDAVQIAWRQRVPPCWPIDHLVIVAQYRRDNHPFATQSYAIEGGQFPMSLDRYADSVTAASAPAASILQTTVLKGTHPEACMSNVLSSSRSSVHD
jgi:hypothetical protein